MTDAADRRNLRAGPRELQRRQYQLPAADLPVPHDAARTSRATPTTRTWPSGRTSRKGYDFFEVSQTPAEPGTSATRRYVFNVPTAHGARRVGCLPGVRDRTRRMVAALSAQAGVPTPPRERATLVDIAKGEEYAPPWRQRRAEAEAAAAAGRPPARARGEAIGGVLLEHRVRRSWRDRLLQQRRGAPKVVNPLARGADPRAAHPARLNAAHRGCAAVP